MARNHGRDERLNGESTIEGPDEESPACAGGSSIMEADDGYDHVQGKINHGHISW